MGLGDIGRHGAETVADGLDMEPVAAQTEGVCSGCDEYDGNKGAGQFLGYARREYYYKERNDRSSQCGK